MEVISALLPVYESLDQPHNSRKLALTRVILQLDVGDSVAARKELDAAIR